MPGKTTLSMAAANSCLRRIMPARGPRSVLWVVEVTMWACGTGDGCSAACDQSGEVRHVHQEERADFVGNLAHAGEIDDARIGAAAADDQLGVFFLRQLFQIVVVDGLGFFGDAVGDDL